MNIFKDKKISIIFGNAKTNAFKIPLIYSLIDNYRLKASHIVKIKFLEINSEKLIKNIFFLRQTHSIDGIILKNYLKSNSFDIDGDYIISNIKNLGIGILTADCLPIIFYDDINSIIAIAHAGWPGTLANITKEVIKKMNINFNSKIQNLKIFFGPSAKVCCYEVQANFLTNLDKIILDKVIINKNNKIYFNLPLYNFLKLTEMGISIKNIDLKNNICTICNVEYCSYRREKENSGRQMTIVTLN